MPTIATIRGQRNSFPKIRKLAEGEVLHSESGQTKGNPLAEPSNFLSLQRTHPQSPLP